MFERFVKALKIAVRDEGFAQIPRNGLLLVIIGTLTYTTTQDWSLVDGFYFAVATLTTSSIADPDLTITGAPIKIFTVFYVLVGIGILVELARQLGCLYRGTTSRGGESGQGRTRSRNLTEPLRARSSSASSASRLVRPKPERTDRAAACAGLVAIDPFGAWTRKKRRPTLSTRVAPTQGGAGT